MNIELNLNLSASNPVLARGGNTQTGTVPILTAGDNGTLSLRFWDGITSKRISNFNTIKFGSKVNLNDAAPVLFIPNFTEDSDFSGYFYIAPLNLNTEELITALFGKSSVELYTDVEIAYTNGHVQTLQFKQTVRNQVIDAETPAVMVAESYPAPAAIELKANKGIANGYAPLDESGHVPSDFVIYPAPVDVSGKQDISEKGMANGYAPLDGDARISWDFMPPMPPPVDLSLYAELAGATFTGDITWGDPDSGAGGRITADGGGIGTSYIYRNPLDGIQGAFGGFGSHVSTIDGTASTNQNFNQWNQYAEGVSGNLTLAGSSAGINFANGGNAIPINTDGGPIELGNGTGNRTDIDANGVTITNTPGDQTYTFLKSGVLENTADGGARTGWLRLAGQGTSPSAGMHFANNGLDVPVTTDGGLVSFDCQISATGANFSGLIGAGGGLAASSIGAGSLDINGGGMTFTNGGGAASITTDGGVVNILNGANIGTTLYAAGGVFYADSMSGVGFFSHNSAQASAIPDATDSSDVVGKFNGLLAAMRAYGLIAS